MENKEFKHTPGPWHRDKSETNYIYDSEGNTVFMFELGAHAFENPTDNANINLAANAPELLKALIEVRKHGLIEKDGHESLVKMIGETIKKATE